MLLKIYICGYLNRIQLSRRLGREAQRNVELMWLTGRLRSDFKTIANFREDNGRAIRNVYGGGIEIPDGDGHAETCRNVSNELLTRRSTRGE